MSTKWITRVFLIVYAVFLVVHMFNVSVENLGEFDDYSLPVASIVNDFNFNISDADVELYKEIFPEWSEEIDNRELSGYRVKSGGEITWYLPVYAIFCMPMVFILKFFGFPAINAFMITNGIFLFLSLIVVYKFLKTSEITKLFIVLALGINPVISYINWVSAEIMIYMLLVMAMVFWHNKWYNRAALSVAVAAMLNPVVFALGLVMGIEFLIGILKENNKLRKLILYGACYIPGLIPFVYNYVHTGFINLTASYDEFTVGSESLLQRFAAYMFDLNFGFLPFYPVLLVLGIFMFFVAIAKRQWRFIGISVAFVLIAILYSVMVHINSGMWGIARYNAWNGVLLVFGVVLFADKLIKSRTCVTLMLALSVAVTGLSIIVYWVSGYDSNYMYPVAKYVLDNAPALYSPLPSTFNARVYGIDGGYDYKTPVVYSDDNGYIRKILASKKDAQGLLLNMVCKSDDGWLENKVAKLSDEAEYISIPKKHKYIRCYVYDTGTPMLFYSKDANCGKYITEGLWKQEEWGTWTKDKVCMRFKTRSSAPYIAGKIYCGVFNDYQRIRIVANGEEVYQGVAENEMVFSFKNPGVGQVIDIEFYMPDAVSPKSLGQSPDNRELALGLRAIVFEDSYN